MAIYLLAASVSFVCGIFLACLYERHKYKRNGCIYLEKNEEGNDRIRFVLDMEYDDIAEHEKIVFDVIKS